MAVLEIDGLRKSYGNTLAVDGLDLTVADGEIFGILGPNGSGKTTTVECAYGLRAADAGRISVFGLDPRVHSARVAPMVGTQLQDSALPDHVTVREAVHLFAALAHGRVDEAATIELWGLTSKRNARFGSLSGGQRQRLFVALALLARPRLVFLDEMTTGLDPTARREIWLLVQRIRDEGTTVVLVTHFMDEAERLCDRVAVMVDGRIVAEDTPGGLVDRYGGGTRARFRLPAVDVGLFARLPGVTAARRHADLVEVQGEGAFLTTLGHCLTVHGHAETQIQVTRGCLEDAYVALLGGAETKKGAR